MITLSGISGGGTCICTGYLPNRESSGKGFLTGEEPGFFMPPSDWLLPPPNSVWYPLEYSSYGPKIFGLEVGDIQSVDFNSADYNPCEHTTMRGDALYLGPLGQYAPYWRIPSTPAVSSFTACDDKIVKPTLTSRRFVFMSGAAASASNLRARNYKGELVSINASSSYDDTSVWSGSRSLPANFAPPGLQTTLRQLGELYQWGRWSVRNSGGTTVTDPSNNTTWYRTVWYRPDRTTFVRETWSEYHSTASYTPATSTAYTEYPYVVEANHRVSTFKVTHIQSTAAGYYHIRYDQTTALTWKGWLYPSAYSRAKTVTTTGLVRNIQVMEPGLSAVASVPLDLANDYCQFAKARAALLYDSRAASNARINAVRDVQTLESNWIENLAGAKGTLQCVQPLIQGYKALETGNLKLARKSLAAAYLVYKYVIAPGIRDVQDLQKNGLRILDLATFHRFSDERRRGMTTQVDIPVCETKASIRYSTVYHLRLKDDPFTQVWAALERVGLDPALGNLWDLIPYSFVVDWFLPVGDSLKAIDAYTSLVCNRDILGRIESFKVQWPVEEQVLKFLFGGNICSNGRPIEYSWYDRRVYDDPGMFNPLDINYDYNGLTVSQMAQGAALLTLYKR